MTVRSVAWRELILSLCVTQSQSAAAWSIVNTLWHNFGVRHRIFGLLLAATFEATSQMSLDQLPTQHYRLDL
jgi:predicted outer membrane lipoprotein